MKTYNVTATETTRFSMVSIMIEAESKRAAKQKAIADNSSVKGFTVLRVVKE